MKGRIGIVVLVVAVAAAVASALYLHRVQKVVERTTKPVEIAAPDLYPADTLLFAAAHRMDESWNAVESWWRKFEKTATWYYAKKQWDEARAQGNLPPPVKEAVESFEKAMDDAEKRLGYRPTTKEFFETYGKYTAFGLLPAKDAGRPRMLLVVKLPGEAAMAMLKEKLGGVAKRHEPPDLHGYPAFQEEGGALGKIYYGIGGGYLFVADEAGVLGDSLGRLAALAGTEKPSEGAASPASLSGDPVFRRGVPETWADVGMALFARKDQHFERWNANLKILDEFVRHAFVLAPSDPAFSLSAVRIAGGADYEVRASFGGAGGAARAWPELLPSGCCTASMTAPPKTPVARETLLSGVEFFRGKPIWKETDALLRDTPRLKRILGEALGTESVPEEEVLRRLPQDGAFVAEAFREIAERSVLSPSASFAFGQKVMEEGGPHVETVFAGRFGPLESLLLVASLNTATEHGGEMSPKIRNPMEKLTEDGVLSWRFHVSRVIEDVMPSGRGMDKQRNTVVNVWANLEPGLVLHGGTLWLTLGEGMHREIRALAAGKGKALAGDDLFRESQGAVPADPETLTFQRPSEAWRGAAGGIRTTVQNALEAAEAPPEGRDIVTAFLAAFDEVVRWQGSVRASVAASYADPAMPSESVVFMDVAAEAKGVRLGLDPAKLAAPDLLPAGTFALAEGRIEVRPAADAFVAAFLRGLPGGRERWDELRSELEVGPEVIEDRLEALLVDMKGEAGMAFAAPMAPDAKEELGPQDLLDRSPALVLFAGYADPDRAFETVKGLFRDLADATQERTPFERRRADFDRRRGPPPVGTAVKETGGGTEGAPAVSFVVFWPERPRGPLLEVGMSVVRRGDLLFLTTSLPAGRSIAAAEPGDPSTFGARMRAALPAGTLPAECSSLMVFREDSFADCMALYSRPLAPRLANFTIHGDENGPPPRERLQAHQEGWKRVSELVEDLFRTGMWDVGATVREKDRFRTTTRRVPGK